ncbi:NADPH-dependent FMN reductase [Reyranella sp.]|uniref:NADPH-dependent FMN reductase n=1 Tax=Reyranella sp. TaxID=1929291 RepID=UPI003BAAAEC3
MVTPLNVAVLVGSLRKDAYSRKIAHVLMGLAPASLDCRIVELADLPLYTEDLDSAPPASWTRFRSEIQAADAVLIVTPEYNRSIPGGLKNAIDVGSRPPYHSVWDGLPTAVVSVSPYKLGGFGANHHIRQSLVFLNMPVMQQPEAYLPEVAGMLDERGALVSAESREFLTKVISSFAAWAQTLAATSSSRPAA